MGGEAWTRDLLGVKDWQWNGGQIPRRSIANLMGGVSVADNPLFRRTDITIVGGGVGGGSTFAFRTGAGAPSNGLGADGDVYLQTSNGDMWQRQGGVYSVVANVRGPSGAVGSTGATGPQGPAGQDGGTGSGTGTTWRSGSVAPSNGLGVNGDWYINTSNGFLYEKVSNAYIVRMNIMGPTGATGSQGGLGQQGPQGLPGAQGQPGVQGIPGIAGQTGQPGPAGTTGPAGVPGSKWHQGTGAPGTGLGIVGDFYLNNQNSSYYEKTGATTWTLRGALTAATSAVNVSFAPYSVLTANNVQAVLQQIADGFARLNGGNTFNGNQVVSSGDVRVSAGRIYTGANAPPGPGDIRASAYVYADGNVQAGVNLTAGNAVEAVNNVHSTSGVIYTGNFVGAVAGDIAAVGSLRANSAVYAPTHAYDTLRTFQRREPIGSTGVNMSQDGGSWNGRGWEWVGGYWVSRSSGTNAPTIFFALTSLPTTGVLDSVWVKVRPSAARTGTNRVRASLIATNTDALTTTPLGTNYDDGGTGYYEIPFLSLNHGLNSTNNVYVYVSGGWDNAGLPATFDQILAIRLSFRVQELTP